MELGRLAEALAHFRRAAALAPRDERMPFNLGNALGRASRPAEAAAAYQRALAINPDFPDAHVNLGTLLSSRGRYKEALPHFERAAELAPESPFMQNNLGSALAALGRFSGGPSSRPPCAGAAIRLRAGAREPASSRAARPQVRSARATIAAA